MFVDARQLPEGSLIEADVCVIGAGVAGITIALECERQGLRTCLLESGGFAPDQATNDLCRGESVGLPYRFDTLTRSRFLGGASNLWGGWCAPMVEQDFESRQWVPYSGWPFRKSELDRYYERSHEILTLGPNNYDVGFWVEAIRNPEVKRIPFISGRVVDAISQFSSAPRFGQQYRRQLTESKFVTVYLYANAINIATDGGQAVREVKSMTLTSRTARVSAKIYVVAAGGIENARLLLVSTQDRPGGIGNHNDMVGRFFMDHPRLYSGQIRLRRQWSRNMLYDIKFHYRNPAVSAHGTCVASQFVLAPEVQAKEGLLNARVSLSSFFVGEDSEASEALIRIRRQIYCLRATGHDIGRDMMTLAKHPLSAAAFALSRLRRPRALIRYSRFQVIAEPAPDPQSRVRLLSSRDPLGMNRASIEWRLDSSVRRTVDRTVAIVAEELKSTNVAEVTLDPPIERGVWPKTFSDEGTWHHMGTTRMHESASGGVVDENCLVHGMNNLYVAGSSIFPTAGANFPTITIVALALRLSEWIARRLGRHG